METPSGVAPSCYFFLAAQGLQGLHAFFAAHGLHGLQAFFAAHGLHGLQPLFFAAHGLHGLHAASWIKVSWPAALAASGRTLSAPAPASAAMLRAVIVFFNIYSSSSVRIPGRFRPGLRNYLVSLLANATWAQALIKPLHNTVNGRLPAVVEILPWRPFTPCACRRDKKTAALYVPP
jgi:hypothetical protein